MSREGCEYLWVTVIHLHEGRLSVCQLKSCSAPVSATCSLDHTLQHFSSATRFRSEITERKVWCVLFALYLSGHGYLSPQQQAEKPSEIMWVWNPGYICSCLNFTVESCRCTSATQRLLDNTNIGDANSASLTSWIKDMTANTEEVKGQSACFSHLINPAAAPDSSVLSVLEGGDSLEQTVRVRSSKIKISWEESAGSDLHDGKILHADN